VPDIGTAVASLWSKAVFPDVAQSPFFVHALIPIRSFGKINVLQKIIENVR
jgi:hypothetical protein